jgi:hypothetical protein
VGTVGTFLLRNAGDDTGAAASANLTAREQQERSAAVSLTRVSASGTAYSAAQLGQQVNSLLAKPPAAATPLPAKPSGADTAAEVGGAASGNTALTDPKALAGCLSALDTPAGVRPLAVDLGSFNGQEAAIIVLPAPDKGYEVWAVARTCGPQDDGTISYRVVPAQ